MTDGISWNQLMAEAGPEIETSYDPLPERDFEFEIVDASFTWTKKQPPKKMWKIQAKVVNDAEAKWNNRRVFNNMVRSPENPKAMNILLSQFAVLGLNRDYFATEPTDEAIATALKGRRFRGSVKQKPYNGEIQNEIVRFKPSQLAAGAVPGAPAAAAPAGVPAPPMPAAAQPVAPPPVAAPPVPAPAPPAPQAAAPAPPAPAPAAPAAADPWAAPPAPAPAPAAPAQPESATPAPPPLQQVPF